MKKFLTAKKDIHNLDFQGLDKTWIKINWNWFIPQCLATLSQLAPPIKDKQGYCAPATREQIEFIPLARSIFNILTTSPRSLYVLNQTTSNNYNQSIPLVLMSYKLYHNVLYDSWDDPIPLLEPLHITMYNNRKYYTSLPDPSTLDWKTYPVPLGCHRTPSSWHPETIGVLDRLTKHCYLQTWLWHPNLIDRYSIQGIYNWDQPQISHHNSTIF